MGFKNTVIFNKITKSEPRTGSDLRCKFILGPDSGDQKLDNAAEQNHDRKVVFLS
jgi:hypothetical protein